MRKVATLSLLLVLVCAPGLAQLSSVAVHNPFTTKANFPGPDSLKPYLNDQGVRSVWADDIDNDGKVEILATDYSNNGRVHVFKYTAPNKLDLVWSSPRFPTAGSSVPRWVQTGDLDGNGMKEIIFPIGPTYAGQIQVYQYNGAGGYGATPGLPDLVLPANQLVPLLGAGSELVMNCERGTVYDFDKDGRDELIVRDRNNGVYIFGVVGDIGGFASWSLEGGDPAVNPENGGNWAGGSIWHCVPADIDGDGKKEIVCHHFDSYAFWSIDVKGPDSYRYPTPGTDSATNVAAKSQFYHRYIDGADGVAYMGIVPIDVDGDGKQEIAGIMYSPANAATHFAAGLISLSRSDTGVYVWKDNSQLGLIGTNIVPTSPKELWGSGAYDLNGNGREELLLCGFGGSNVVSLEYKGSGSILDGANYTKTVLYPGDAINYNIFTFFDSLGVKKDTTREETPFVSKMWVGKGITGPNDKNMVLAYQSAYDSLTYTWKHWDTTSIPKLFKQDSTKKVKNPGALNIRLLKWTGSSFAPIDVQVVTPEEYVLEQNYPNPFNPSTEIRFSLPIDKRISLTVFDMLGQKVKTLINDQDFKEGSHTATWDGTNDAGTPVATGSYVYTLKYGNFQKSQKMMLVR